MPPREDYYWPALYAQYKNFLESIGFLVPSVLEEETDVDSESDDDDIPEGYLLVTDTESEDWSDDDDDDLPSMEEVARLSNQ